MELTFFGQYLVNHGLINARQLDEALTVAFERNRLIGALAVQAGYLTEEQVSEIHRDQRRTDRYFGQLAIRKGWLKRQQMERLLDDQRTRNARIGDVLVELGYVERGRVETMHQRFLADQAEHHGEARLPHPVSNTPLTRYALDLFPRLVQRITTKPAKIGRGTVWSSRRGVMNAMSIGLTGSVDLTTTIVPSERQAREITQALLGLMPSDHWSYDRAQIADALSDFMNLYADTVKARANELNVDLEVGIPLPGRLPDEGYSFPVLTPGGPGAVVLKATR